MLYPLLLLENINRVSFLNILMFCIDKAHGNVCASFLYVQKCLMREFTNCIQSQLL